MYLQNEEVYMYMTKLLLYKFFRNERLGLNYVQNDRLFFGDF